MKRLLIFLFLIAMSTTGFSSPSTILVANQGIDFNLSGVLAFPTTAKGNILPQWTIQNATLTHTNALYLQNHRYLWVTDFISKSVQCFDLDSKSSTPRVLIQGDKTQLTSPDGIALDASGNIYVADFNSNTVFIYSSRYQTPGVYNVAPIASIKGDKTQFDQPANLRFDSVGNLYVASAGGGRLGAGPSIAIFAPQMTGNIAPLRRIAGAHTTLSLIGGMTLDDHGNIWVGNLWNMLEFAPGANGDVSPLCTIQDGSTMQNIMAGIAVDSDGTIYEVSDFPKEVNSAVNVFPSPVNCNGKVLSPFPLRTITGKATGLRAPKDILLY